MAALLLSTSGCALALYAAGPPTGTDLAAENVQQLRLGMSPAEVEAVLGPPLKRVRRHQGERWLYRQEAGVRACRSLLLGFVPLQPVPRIVRELRLDLGPAGLIAARLRQKGYGGRRVVFEVGPASWT